MKYFFMGGYKSLVFGDVKEFKRIIFATFGNNYFYLIFEEWINIFGWKQLNLNWFLILSKKPAFNHGQAVNESLKREMTKQ